MEDAAIAAVLNAAVSQKRERPWAAGRPGGASLAPTPNAAAALLAKAPTNETQQLLCAIRAALAPASPPRPIPAPAPACSPAPVRHPEAQAVRHLEAPAVDLQASAALPSLHAPALRESVRLPQTLHRPPPTPETYTALSRTIVAAHASRVASSTAAAPSQTAAAPQAGTEAAAGMVNVAHESSLPLCRVMTLDREGAAAAEAVAMVSAPAPQQWLLRGVPASSPRGRWEEAAVATEAGLTIPARLLGDVHHRALIARLAPSGLSAAARLAPSGLSAAAAAAPAACGASSTTPPRAQRATLFEEEWAASLHRVVDAVAAATETEEIAPLSAGVEGVSAGVGADTAPAAASALDAAEPLAADPFLPPAPERLAVAAPLPPPVAPSYARSDAQLAAAAVATAAVVEPLLPTPRRSSRGATDSGHLSAASSAAATPTAASAASVLSALSARGAAASAPVPPPLLVALPPLTPAFARALRREAAGTAAGEAAEAVAESEAAAALTATAGTADAAGAPALDLSLSPGELA